MTEDLRLHKTLATTGEAPGYHGEGHGGTAHGFRRGGLGHEEHHEAPEHGRKEHVHHHTKSSVHRSHKGHVHTVHGHKGKHG